MLWLCLEVRKERFIGNSDSLGGGRKCRSSQSIGHRFNLSQVNQINAHFGIHWLRYVLPSKWLAESGLLAVSCLWSHKVQYQSRKSGNFEGFSLCQALHFIAVFIEKSQQAKLQWLIKFYSYPVHYVNSALLFFALIKSKCRMQKGKDLEVYPVSWGGSFWLLLSFVISSLTPCRISIAFFGN